MEAQTRTVQAMLRVVVAVALMLGAGLVQLVLVLLARTRLVRVLVPRAGLRRHQSARRRRGLPVKGLR